MKRLSKLLCALMLFSGNIALAYAATVTQTQYKQLEEECRQLELSSFLITMIICLLVIAIVVFAVLLVRKCILIRQQEQLFDPETRSRVWNVPILPRQPQAAVPKRPAAKEEPPPHVPSPALAAQFPTLSAVPNIVRDPDAYQPVTRNGERLDSIGGWLAFFMIAQGLGIVSNLISITKSEGLFNPYELVLLGLPSMILTCMTIYYLAKARACFFITFLGTVLCSACDVVITIILSASFSLPLSVGFFGNFISALGYATVWSLYFVNSERVKGVMLSRKSNHKEYILSTPKEKWRYILLAAFGVCCGIYQIVMTCVLVGQYF